MFKLKNIFLKDIFQDLIDKMNADNNSDVAFYYGTPIETNIVHQRDYATDKVSLKYPFIALFLNGEDGQIRRENDPSSSYYGVAQCWFVIMTNSKFADSKTANVYNTKLQTTAEIYEKLMQTIEKRIDNTIGRPTNEDVIEHVKWGLIAKFNGSTSNVFADELAGKEITMNLPIIKKYENC